MDKESGMVAIVHGLKDAGLKVTLMGRSPEDNLERKHSDRTLQPSPPRFLNVTSPNNRSVQICDGRYTSSYQLAHCNMKPTSPAVAAPEFPVQKVEPCRNSGNFEIGDSTLMRAMPSECPASPCRYSLVDTTPTPCHTSRETEFFANTLRKYPTSPSASPERSMSSELVQRLISYTQNKNLTKSSYHTKNLNTKSQNTENRSQKRNESPTRDISSFTNDELRNSFAKRGTVKNNQLYITKSDSKYVRYKDNVLNCSYDYQKSTRMPPHKKERKRQRVTEVRYLNDITKCIRDTLRSMYEDKPELCPNIRSRYCHHQRSHHRQSSNLVSFDSSQEEEAQAILPSTSRAAETIQSDDLQDPRHPCCCRLANEIKTDVMHEICRIILEWEKEIPVHANEPVEDKTERRAIMQKLADILQQSDVAKYRNEIIKCLNEVPMWNPGDENEQEKLKNYLANSLLQKLDNVSGDTFDEEVNKFVDSLPLTSEDENELAVIKEKIVSDMIKKVKYLALYGLPGEKDYIEILTQEIEKILEEFPLDISESEKKVIIKNLANVLTVDISKTPPSADRLTSLKEIKGRNYKIQQDIPDTVKDNLDLCNVKKNIRERRVSSRLAVAESHNLDDNKIRMDMQNKINRWGKELSPSTDDGTHKMFANKPVNNIDDEHNHQIEYSIQETTDDDLKYYKQHKVTDDILQYIESATGDTSLNIKEKRKTLTDKLLTEMVDILISPSKTYREKERLLNEKVNKYLNDLSLRTDLPNEELKSKLVHKTGKSFKTSSPQHSADDFFLLGETIPSIIEMQGREELEFVQNITDALQNWADNGLNHLNKNVKDCFVKDLIAEVLNRKKYLRANSQRIPSEEEDIELLNYQIFKLLNEKVDEIDLLKVQSETKNLVKKLKSIPELMRPLENKGELKKESLVTDFVDVIAKWLEEIPPHMFKSKTLVYKKAMIKKLAEKLHNLKANQDHLSIDTEIKSWLKLMLNDDHGLDLNNAVKNLRAKLGLLKAAPEIFDESHAKCLEEYLIDVIFDWMTNEKALQRRNTIEKLTQKQLITELVQNILSQLESTLPYNNLENLWLNKITNMLKRFPMDPYQISDENYLRRIAGQLLSYLKMLPAFKEISDTRTSLAVNKFSPVIEDWINTLQLNPKSSIDYKQIEELKTQLLKILEQIQGQTLTGPDKQKIKAEILKFMLTLPLVSSKKNDVQFKEEKAENLLDKICETLNIKRSSKQMQSNIIESSSEPPSSSLNENIKRKNTENLLHKLASTERLSRNEKTTNNDMEEDLPNKIMKNIYIDSPYKVLINKKLKSDTTSMKKKAKHLHEITDRLNKRQSSLQISKDHDVLKDNIEENLIDELASNEGLSKDEEITIKDMRENLAKKPINKIRTISNSSKVLHDNFTDLLQDNIDESINSVPISAVTARKLKNYVPFMIDNAEHLHNISEKTLESRHSSSKLPKDSHDVLKENIENLIDELASSEGLSRYERNIIKDMKKDLVKKLMDKMGDLNCPTKVLLDNFTDELKDKIYELINSLPINIIAKRKLNNDSSFIKEKAEHLRDIIIDNLDTKHSSLQVPKSSHDVIEENLDKLFDKLVASDNLSFTEKNKINNMKPYLTNKLMSEMGDLNSSSKILHDNFQDVIQDKIDKLINILPLSTAAKRKLRSTKHLMEEIAEGLVHIIREGLNLRYPSLQVPKSCQDILRENIGNLFDKIVYRKDLSDEDKNKIVNIKEDLTDKVMREIGDLYSQSKLKRNDFQDILKDRFYEVVNTLPISTAAKMTLISDENVIGDKSDRLTEIITNTSYKEHPSKQLLKNSQDILQENVAKWFDDLSSTEGITSKELNIIKNIKPDLVQKLMSKINELNMDPEVLHDDFLYEHLLRDKVDRIINSMPISEAARNKLNKPAEKLIEKVKKGKINTENEFAGKVYRHQLKESLSKSIPRPSNMSLEDKAEFEMLIDKLADDFTNLLYVADDSDKKHEYKDSINREIRNFVKNNLASSVGHINVEQLNKDLYNTLKQVPVPADDFMKSEVSALNIKDITTKFIADLPLNIESQQKKQEINKLISGFSKTINQIENNIEIDDINYDKLLNDEITKLFKQLSFQDVSEFSLQEFKEQLANRISNSRLQRRRAIKRSSIDFDDVHMCPYYKMLLEQICDSSCISQHKTKMPKSTLNAEDKALLQKIMQRNSYEKKVCHEDKCIGPPPLDASSQTGPSHQNPSLYECSRSRPLKLVYPGSEYEDKATCVLSESQIKLLETCHSCGKVHIPNDNQDHLQNMSNLVQMQSGCRVPSASPQKLQKGCTPIIQRPCIPRMTPSCHNFNRNPCTVIPKPTSYCRPSCNDRTRTCPSSAKQTPAGFLSSRTRCRPSYRIGRIDQTKNLKNWPLHLKMRQSREKVFDTDLTDSDQCISCNESKASKFVQECFNQRRQNENCEVRDTISRSGYNGCWAHPVYSQSGSFQKCARCYGTHCPYPSDLYFKS